MMTASNKKIIDLNQDLERAGLIYIDRTITQESKVNDSEKAIEDVLDSINDRSWRSIEIENKLDTPLLNHALGFGSDQYLDALHVSNLSTALVIEGGYGSVSRCLGDYGLQVESVQYHRAKAALEKKRSQDLENVRCIAADINTLILPSTHYNLIVVRDFESLEMSTASKSALLKKLNRSLTEQGVLLVATDNPNAIRNWFASDSSPTGQIPYQALYQQQSELSTRSEWVDDLKESGFKSIQWNSIYPNKEHCRTLLSASYIDKEPSSLNHFYRMGAIEDDQINEYLLWKRLFSKGDTIEHANRFLFLASSSVKATKQVHGKDFSHFSGSGRQAQWRTLTWKDQSKKTVQKSSLYAQSEQSSNTVVQHLDDQSYATGTVLAGKWLESLIGQEEENSFEESLETYAHWLQAQEKEGSITGRSFDLLPFNIIVDHNNTYQIIDPEWEVDLAVSADYIFFRALFWFGFENRSLLSGYCKAKEIFTVGDFVEYGLGLMGAVDKLGGFVEKEEQAQRLLENQFKANAVSNAMRMPLHNTTQSAGGESEEFEAQAFWSDSASVMKEEDSGAVMGKTGVDRQLLTIPLTDSFQGKRYLRIDPVDTQGNFHFYSLQVLGKKNEILINIDQEKDIANSSQIVNAEFCSSAMSSFFLALNDDPHFIFDLNQFKDLGEAHKLVIEVSWSWSNDYALAMSQLGHSVARQQEAMQQQKNRIEEHKARHAELQANFEFLQKNSEVQTDRIFELSTYEAKAVQLEAIVKELKTAKAYRLQMFLGGIFKELIPEHVRRLKFGLGILRRDGFKAFLQAYRQRSAVVIGAEQMGQNNEDYAKWIEQNTFSEQDIAAAKSHIETMQYQPRFSILVPVYNVDEKWLTKTVESVQNQIYENWQLCLVDDASPAPHIKPLLKKFAEEDSRISIQLNDHNQGIALSTNDALSLANGDYVALLDHDDEISIDALYQNAVVLNDDPEVGVIYSDEDKMTLEGERVDPFFKPDFSQDLLDSQNYICHFTVIKKTIADEIGGFREGVDGSQDHDIIIRSIEKTDKVVHIPRILYHWRKIPGSTAAVYNSKSYAWEAGRKAVEDRAIRNNIEGTAMLGALQGTYRLKRDIIGSPLISIVIPFKDRPDLLQNCLDSILSRSTWENYEIIGVSNNSELTETKEMMERYSTEHDHIHFHEKNVPFNFSTVCNYGVEKANGEYIILLNNDIEIETPEWMECLLEHAQRDEVGAVGGKLCYPDGRIQHAGIVVGMAGAAGHPHKFFHRTNVGYYARLHVVSNVSAVTAAMLMVSKQKYEDVGGLEEESLAVAYNDIDFSLKLGEIGLVNVFTPFCEAIHHESVSRGYEDTPEKIARLNREKAFFLDKWKDVIGRGDPFYNRNLSLDYENFTINLHS